MRQICFWVLLVLVQVPGRKGQSQVQAAAPSQLEAPFADNWNPDLNSVRPSMVHTFSFWRDSCLEGNYGLHFTRVILAGCLACMGAASLGTVIELAQVSASWSSRLHQGTLLSLSTVPSERLLLNGIFYQQIRGQAPCQPGTSWHHLPQADLSLSLYLVGWICFTCI